MNIGLLCKRHYTNRDLITKPIGRHFHFPKHWTDRGCNVFPLLADYYAITPETKVQGGCAYMSFPFFPLPFIFYCKAYRYFKSNRIDVIIASGDPILGYLAIRLSKKLYIPMIFDLYHDYADFGLTKTIPFLKPLYRYVLKESDLLACDSKPLLEKLEKYNSKADIFTQGTDIDLFYPRDKIESRNFFKLEKSSYLIGLTGSLDRRIDLKLVLEAIELIARDYKIDVKLVIAGINAERFDLSNSRIIFLGELPQENIPILLSACDVLTIPMVNEGLATTCNPCKLSEYMAVQRPIVVTDFSNISDYITSDLNIVFSSDPQEMSEKLYGQLIEPNLYKLPESFQWKTISEKYYEKIETLVEEKIFENE